MSISSAKIIWNEIQPQTQQIHNGLGNCGQLLEISAMLSQRLNAIFSGKQKLSDRDMRTLEDAAAQLPQVIPNLSGETQVYFAKLFRICDLIIQSHN